jgi:hypothetical protein
MGDCSPRGHSSCIRSKFSQRSKVTPFPYSSRLTLKSPPAFPSNASSIAVRDRKESEACLSEASWRAPVRDAKHRAAAGRVSRVPFLLLTFLWACKEKSGAAAHPPLSVKSCSSRRA